MFQPKNYVEWNRAVSLLHKHITKTPNSPDEGALLIKVGAGFVTLSGYKSDTAFLRVTLPIINTSPEEVNELLVWGATFKELPTKIKSLDTINISLLEEKIRYSHPELGEIEEGAYLGENIIPEFPEGEEVIPEGEGLVSFFKAIAIDKQPEWPHLLFSEGGLCFMSYYKGAYTKMVAPTSCKKHIQFQLKQAQLLALQELGNIGGLYYLEVEGKPYLTYKGFKKVRNEIEAYYEFTWAVIPDDFEDCLPSDIDWPQTHLLMVDKLRLNDILTWQEYTKAVEIQLSHQPPNLVIEGGTRASCKCEPSLEGKAWGTYKFPLASLLEAIEIKNLPEEVKVSVYEVPLDTGAQPALLLEGDIQKAIVLGEAI
jgi:hypothetical protein